MNDALRGRDPMAFYHAMLARETEHLETPDMPVKVMAGIRAQRTFEAILRARRHEQVRRSMQQLIDGATRQ